MNVIDIIEKHSLTVRCLPHVVTSLWAYDPGQTLKDNQTLITRNGRKFIREERPVEKGGWWYVKETADTRSQVQFSRKYDKFFAPTLEEALTLYLYDHGGITMSTAHLNAMVRALRKMPTFTITRNYTQGTVIARHPGSGEVFRAIKCGKSDFWVIRHHKNLFSEEPTNGTR